MGIIGNYQTMSSSQEIIANHIKLTKDLINFLNGLLLGDGCIVTAPSQKSACYTHTDKHKEYVIWLIKELKTFGLKTSEIRPHNNRTYNFKTIHYREFVEIRKEWYPKGKKKIPNNIRLTPVVLRNWYIGDGSFKHGKNETKKCENLIICSEFDPNGKSFIIKRFNRLGIKTSNYSYGIYIKSASRKRFFEFMLRDKPEIPKCYRYKFPIRYCGELYDKKENK